MTRLKRNNSAYLRSLQISKNKLFTFVEGKQIDPFVVGGLCDAVCTPLEIDYSVRKASELKGAGGKDALKSFYTFLRRESLLETEFKGKKTAILFFFDKDIDDLLKRKFRSRHVIYTEFYDIQNHVFLSANIQKGFAAAASIDISTIRKNSRFRSDWCIEAASRWKEWVKICIFAKKHKIESVANFRIASPINRNLNGTVDFGKKRKLVKELKEKFTGSSREFDVKMKRISKYVDTLFRKGKHDKIFKGKWYSIIAEADLKEEFKGSGFDTDKLSKHLPKILSSDLDFTSLWAKKFRDDIESIALKVK